MPFRHRNKVFVICDKLEFKFPEWRCATVRTSNYTTIITTVATRGQILRLKCTKFYFGCGSAPDPAGGAPYSVAGFKGPILLREGRKGKGAEKEKEGKGGDGKGGEEM